MIRFDTCKDADFHGSVNITLGLDFIRITRSWHSLYIAGKGIARDDSLRQAMATALKWQASLRGTRWLDKAI